MDLLSPELQGWLYMEQAGERAWKESLGMPTPKPLPPELGGPPLRDWEITQYEKETIEEIPYSFGDEKLTIEALGAKEDIDTWYNKVVDTIAMGVAIAAKRCKRPEDFYGHKLVTNYPKELETLERIKRALYRGIGEESGPELVTFNEVFLKAMWFCGEYKDTIELVNEATKLAAEDEVLLHFEQHR